ncbi:universal stress protein [Clostridium cochlearium]|jgi:nucleotide-binding universal stress UspA family protein|uniref:Universal stress protein n=1 Tax=Clostridium cochlearium TaxID=1494 RepID=A0A240AIE0_CLOCO|nr:universal stress protein [Clostridium cochlearium]MBV1820077.1 universal stress protein [Bacteroidales bacterium MSK.15.36]NSJ91989.1 universal stress protein [Coprococcus sp. MSK.21.13]MBE6064920.1 universal stress protein [Clostridium cochlearium]MCG4571565.1 universal stress protein [Clostridium cochlearium]MCG4580544.1 universal stress protein [Clostridium cochlearium]
MEKMKVLIPLDGTDRSMHSLDLLKDMFPKDKVEVTLMNVKEIVIVNGMVASEEIARAQELSQFILDTAERQLKGYDIEKCITFGYAADEILRKSKDENFDIIIMTKSTKKGLTRMIGSVTAKVVKNTKSIVIIVPE